VIVPLSSSSVSCSVVTVSVPVPSVPMLAVRSPSCPSSAKSPLSVTSMFTVSALAGAGEALRLKVMAPPSVTSLPSAMLTTGLSSSATSAVAELFVPCTE